MFIIRFWAIFLSRADLVSQSRDGLVSWIFMSSHEFLRILILNTDPNVKLHGLQLYIVKGPKTDRKFEFITGWTSSYWSDLCFFHGTPSATPSHPRGGLSRICRWGVFRLHIGSRPWAMGQSSSGELQKELLYAEAWTGSSHSVGWVRSE